MPNKKAVVKVSGKTSFDAKREILEEMNDEAILYDGYEDALIGVCHQFGRPPVAIYDYDKCISILKRRDGMTDEESQEYFEFNTLGCGLGDNTPCFVQFFRGVSSHS